MLSRAALRWILFNAVLCMAYLYTVFALTPGVDPGSDAVMWVVGACAVGLTVIGVAQALDLPPHLGHLRRDWAVHALVGGLLGSVFAIIFAIGRNWTILVTLGLSMGIGIGGALARLMNRDDIGQRGVAVFASSMSYTLAMSAAIFVLALPIDRYSLSCLSSLGATSLLFGYLQYLAFKPEPLPTHDPYSPTQPTRHKTKPKRDTWQEDIDRR